MIETLFVHDLELLAPVDATNRYGDVTHTSWVDVGPIVKGWISQRDASEDRSNREAEIGQWAVFLPAWAGLTSKHRVRWLDPTTGELRTFDVIGPVNPAHTPSGPHHIEANLRQVNG